MLFCSAIYILFICYYILFIWLMWLSKEIFCKLFFKFEINHNIILIPIGV